MHRLTQSLAGPPSSSTISFMSMKHPPPTPGPPENPGRPQIPLLPPLPFQTGDQAAAKRDNKSTNIATDDPDQRPRGFGFVEMSSNDDARAAIASLSPGPDPALALKNAEAWIQRAEGKEDADLPPLVIHFINIGQTVSLNIDVPNIDGSTDQKSQGRDLLLGPAAPLLINLLRQARKLLPRQPAPLQSDAVTDKTPPESLSSMVKRLVLPLSQSDIPALEAKIREAQASPPTDKPGFVDEVNFLLAVYRLRLDLGDGTLGWLCIKPGATGRGHIQIACVGGGTRGFKSVPIRIVPLPADSPRVGIPNYFRPDP